MQGTLHFTAACWAKQNSKLTCAGWTCMCLLHGLVWARLRHSALPQRLQVLK
jgi:hypothetical protein